MGRTEESAMLLILFAIIGGIVAIMEYALYNMNILVNTMVDSSTSLYAIMFFTVFMFELAGVVVAASRN